MQEKTAKAFLLGIGFAEVAARNIVDLDAAPVPGKNCGECLFCTSRADVLIRLFDHRALHVECKVSNNAVNFFKFINHETVGKAPSRPAGFGRNQNRARSHNKWRI